MFLKRVDGPRQVTLPDGRILTRADLPPAETRRWVASRKAVVVRAVIHGLMSEDEALTRYGTPEIFNSDQGSQFTSTEFTQVLLDAKVKISMDGRGRWIDNRMIERLWRSLKYDCVYLNAFETGSEARRGIGASAVSGALASLSPPRFPEPTPVP